jgi:hypothetical protein
MVVRLTILLILSFCARPLFSQVDFNDEKSYKQPFRKEYNDAMSNRRIGFDCSQSLINAEKAYYGGRFSEMNELCNYCLANGFDKEQRTEAYRLLSLSYLFSKNFEKADSTLLLMLKNNPQYEFKVPPPPEFRSRVERFKVHPLVEVTTNLGLLLPSFKVDEVYSSRVLPTTVTYTGKPGVHVGISVAYYLNQKVSVRGGYEFQSYSFSIEDKNQISTGLMTESQRRTQWQAAAGYAFKFSKVSLQVYGGIVYSTLRKADSYLVLGRNDSNDEVVFNYSNVPQRTQKELRPMIELKLNIPQRNQWLVSLSTRYELGIENMTNSENRYSNLGNATQLEWVEDDFKGRYLIISLGISKLFYRISLK